MADLGAIAIGSVTADAGGGTPSGGGGEMLAVALNLLAVRPLAVAINGQAASTWQEFVWVPSYGTSVEVTPRVRKAQFGDGYAQRTGDGINNQPQMWSLRFDNMPLAEASAMIAFLEAHGGTTPFRWTPPGESTMQFICEKWPRTLDRYGVSQITLSFEQDFTP